MDENPRQVDELLNGFEEMVAAYERGEGNSIVRELEGDELLSWFAVMSRWNLLAGRFTGVLRAEIERREGGG